MATTDNAKILGQLYPSAATSTKLYTVPASASTVISSIVVCNESAVATSFRISVAVADASSGVATKQYLYYDVAIGGNDTFIATIGLTLATTDTVYVYATLGTLAFNMFGIETVAS